MFSISDFSPHFVFLFLSELCTVHDDDGDVRQDGGRKGGREEEEEEDKVGGLTVSDDFLRVGAILLSLGRAGSVFIQGGLHDFITQPELHEPVPFSRFTRTCEIHATQSLYALYFSAGFGGAASSARSNGVLVESSRFE